MVLFGTPGDLKRGNVEKKIKRVQSGPSYTAERHQLTSNERVRFAVQPGIACKKIARNSTMTEVVLSDMGFNYPIVVSCHA